MLEIERLSSRYAVRRMREADADAILELCLQNTQYYQYCGKQPSRELILSDLRALPPRTAAEAKYYVGFYAQGCLAAVMDLIDGYPEAQYAFIGFFMMNRGMQGRQLGSALIGEVCAYLAEAGKTAVRLGIDKGNPQSTHFWQKNGFYTLEEIAMDGGKILYAERRLK